MKETILRDSLPLNCYALHKALFLQIFDPPQIALRQSAANLQTSLMSNYDVLWVIVELANS